LHCRQKRIVHQRDLLAGMIAEVDDQIGALCWCQGKLLEHDRRGSPWSVPI
jgi:hypothetical protein